MSGLQRDHTVNESWTNHEGYNDGTAGAAINNIMRQSRKAPAPPAPTKKLPDKLGGTTFIQVEHKAARAKPKQTQAAPKPKPHDQALLKMARTLFTICTMICRMQGFTIEAITLHDKASGTSWVKSELEAPQQK